MSGRPIGPNPNPNPVPVPEPKLPNPNHLPAVVWYGPGPLITVGGGRDW